MSPYKVLSPLPCWARDLSLLKHDARDIVACRVQTLNEVENDDSQWYDCNLTTTQRAETILLGIIQHRTHCWVARDLDNFVFNLCRILWPDVVYRFRGMIFAADAKWIHAHRDDKSKDGDCCFCRENAYRACAIQLLACVLEDCETWQDATRHSATLSRRATQNELPDWVRQPAMLEVLLHRNVVDAIRALNNSSDEPFWHLATTTKDRVDILLARLQRQFHSSVACCVEGRRATGALFYFLQSDFALDLRSDIAKQIRARSRAHSSDWHRMNGVWLVVKHALRTIVQEFEQSAEEEPVPESTTHRLRDWFNKYLMLGKRADRRN